MLVLTRLIDQTIVISGPCTLTVLGVSGGPNPRVKLGVAAAPDVGIYRGEVLRRAKAVG